MARFIPAQTTNIRAQLEQQDTRIVNLALFKRYGKVRAAGKCVFGVRSQAGARTAGCVAEPCGVHGAHAQESERASQHRDGE